MRINPREVPGLPPSEKVCTYGEMPEFIYELKLAGQRVVLAQGVFDILHLGHIQYIQGAARHGLVVVGIENDTAVKVNKGPARPINSAQERMLSLAAFEAVGLVFAFDDAPPYGNPEPYIQRYRELQASVAVPEWDPHFELKAFQGMEAEVDIVRIQGHYPNSTTQMLRTVGYAE